MKSLHFPRQVSQWMLSVDQNIGVNWLLVNVDNDVHRMLLRYMQDGDNLVLLVGVSSTESSQVRVMVGYVVKFIFLKT